MMVDVDQSFLWGMVAQLSVILIQNIGAAPNLDFVEAPKSIVFVTLAPTTGLFH